MAHTLFVNRYFVTYSFALTYAKIWDCLDRHGHHIDYIRIGPKSWGVSTSCMDTKLDLHLCELNIYNSYIAMGPNSVTP
jgi:uncharacterized membrane protein YwaF